MAAQERLQPRLQPSLEPSLEPRIQKGVQSSLRRVMLCLSIPTMIGLTWLLLSSANASDLPLNFPDKPQYDPSQPWLMGTYEEVQAEPENFNAPQPVEEPAAEQTPASQAAKGTATDGVNTEKTKRTGVTETEIITASETDGDRTSAQGDDLNNVLTGENKAPKFITGELTHPGTMRMLSRHDHFGVSTGPTILGNDFFLSVDPGMALSFDNGVAFALHAPLRLLAFAGGSDIMAGSPELGSFRVRRQDWDDKSDYFRLIRYLTYGRKEADIYFSINTMRPASIGHGMLMSRYQGNIDIDRSLTSVLFDAKSRFGGFELQLNDIALRNQVVGSLFYLKPLSVVPSLRDNLMARSFSIGGEYVADFNAPRCIVRNQGVGDTASQCVRGAGHSAGADPFSGVSNDNTYVRSNKEHGRFDVRSGRVHAAGLSTEVKVLKTTGADIKLYGTLHKFLNEGGGSGHSLGVLSRINVVSGLGVDQWVNAFRLVTEYRGFGDGFIPNYFNSLYEIEKYQFLHQRETYQVTPTKLQRVFGDPENGFEREALGRRQGYLLEGSYGLYKGRSRHKKLALAVGLEDASGDNDTNFYAHIELPEFIFVQLFATYMRNNLDGITDIFTSGALTSTETIVLTGLRMQLLPILFFNVHYARSYQVVRGAGQEYHLGNSTIVDDSGAVEPGLSAHTLFENVHSLFVDIEFGWEFES